MLPLALKISLTILVLLILLLIIAMKKRKFILPIILLILLDIGFGIWQGFKEYNRTNRDFSNVKADVKIAATDLIQQYESNDSLANKKYLGKVIDINGRVKDVKKDETGYYTVVLGDEASMSSVRCSMDTVHQQDAARLVIGSSAIVRGACTGFNKDEIGLGSDVIFNRCVIITEKK